MVIIANFSLAVKLRAFTRPNSPLSLPSPVPTRLTTLVGTAVTKAHALRVREIKGMAILVTVFDGIFGGLVVQNAE